MALASANRQSEGHLDVEFRLRELERRNQLLQAEVERLRMYKDCSYTDVLTEVPNRRFYHDRLRQEMARARRGNHPLTLAVIDIDGFKQLNDRYGHRVGDEILRFFAQFLRVNLRLEDIVCRRGGDEFAVIFPETSAERAGAYFDRVRRKLERMQIAIGERLQIRLTFICGIATFHPEFTPEDFVEQVDHALYSARTRGRNRMVATPAGNATASRFLN